MSGKNPLDAGPAYDPPSRREVRAQEAFDAAEEDRRLFRNLAEYMAHEAMLISRRNNVDPQADQIKWAQEHHMTFPESLLESLNDIFLSMFRLPDPQDEYDDVMQWSD